MAEIGELIWKWIMRLCAVAGFVGLPIVGGVDALMDAPTWYYLLLLGLFFGPEALTGQIGLFAKRKGGDEPAK